MHNNLLQNTVTPNQCWSWTKDTLGPEMFVTLILWWRASGDPFTIKHKGHAGTTSTAHLVSKRPLWPRLKPVFQIIIPSNYWHVLHKWPLDKVTTLRKNINMCRIVAMLWRAQHWPNNNKRHINNFFSGTTKSNIQSRVIAFNHKWTATAP